MANIGNIKYQPTPTEKHLGIVTVPYTGTVILRFKNVAKKDGSGTFLTAPSIKFTTSTGDMYLEAHTIDSTTDKEALFEAIRHAIASSEQKVNMSPQSVHSFHKPQALPQYDEPPINDCPF